MPRSKLSNPSRWSLALLALAAVAWLASSSSAQTLHTLHTFGLPSGGTFPSGRLLADAAGNLYGVTYQGGTGHGTIFELSPPSGNGPWTETVLYNFTNSADDTGPGFDLIADAAGNLYGTTEYSTVFQLVRPSAPGGTWTKNVLHRFTGNPDGFAPSSGLIMDAAGNLYGETWQGGSCSQTGDGTVFELSPPATSGGTWTEQVLYRFQQNCGGFGGSNPSGGLVMGKGGALFGVTANGGSGTVQPGGTVFLLTPPHTGHPDWTETVLHSFDPFVALDGARPEGGLVVDPKGNLYGTTSQGGATPSPCSNYGGCGIVFELSPPAVHGGAWTETILHSFTGGDDGDGPKGTLLLDAKGNLYGVAPFGGASAGCGPYGPCGAVFELTPPATSGGSWSETTLHAFPGTDKNGVFPVGGLTFGAFHRLYGVTQFAGTAQPNARGTVFKLIP